MSLWESGQLLAADTLNRKTLLIGATAPANPADGQLWYDTTLRQLKQYSTDLTRWLRIYPPPVVLSTGVETVDLSGDVGSTAPIRIFTDVFPGSYFARLWSASAVTGYIAAVNRLKNISPSTPGTWNSGPSNIGNGTDENLSTSAYAGSKQVYDDSTYFQWDLGATYTGLLLMKIGYKTTSTMDAVRVRLKVSTDGSSWTMLYSHEYAADTLEQKKFRAFANTTARYIRLTVFSGGTTAEAQLFVYELLFMDDWSSGSIAAGGSKYITLDQPAGLGSLTTLVITGQETASSTKMYASLGGDGP